MFQFEFVKPLFQFDAREPGCPTALSRFAPYHCFPFFIEPIMQPVSARITSAVAAELRLIK